MQVGRVGAAFAVKDPSAAGAWFDQHLGFRVVADLGWYASTQHPAHTALAVDFVQHDHDTWVEEVAGPQGAMLALEVSDVDAEHARLVEGGATVLKALVTEPWGQRRVQLAGPEGLVIELVQPVAPDPEWMAAQGFSS